MIDMNVLDTDITEEESKNIYLGYLIRNKKESDSTFKIEREVYNDMHENLRDDGKVFFYVYNYYKIGLN
ncbi:MAG: hypothetical protein Q7J54_06230 [Candidatus Woesearchaeota archaeon]|nr:hypothetical protein [Candidatus Woesearchaeota archaeon]